MSEHGKVQFVECDIGRRHPTPLLIGARIPDESYSGVANVYSSRHSDATETKSAWSLSNLSPLRTASVRARPCGARDRACFAQCRQFCFAIAPMFRGNRNRW